VRAVLDSDVLIDFLRGYPAAQKLFRGFKEPLPLCSAITVAELWMGSETSGLDKIRRLLENFEVVSIDAEVAQQAGSYVRRFHKSHGVELPDALVAATAYVSRIPLITRNIKHFPMDDIQVVKPY
jgi:predicted nucleic acid-binding protein